MANVNRLAKVVVGLALGSAVAIGSLAFAKPAAAPGCICPDVYAPVICSNGHIYSNGCRASCAHATGCVPWGLDR